ncbi:hypothetical protein M201_gp11 [Haloarcula californiae tailed virus 2]|uniref:ParB-like N-terminal domain-containing protein n=1 Tax=Haloarcula californiae tailed virus 2 TaxID=1273747 RepID=R4THK0_9CAUD|nr:hypothetical protein M201_gp11 [Haloarcula californiae tailed virus 2]AGM11786.1 hypothetical protein HCTV2_11 [Haloarcula californiae tailed virus 2]
MASSEQDQPGEGEEPDPSEVDGAQFSTEVQVWELEDVHPYANNAKEHPDEQVQKIRSSIKNYGWDQPIVVDADGEIIKGHGRRLAAKSLGLERVPVIVRDDLTEGEKKAARIADNKTAESEWDESTLAAEFEALEDREDLDLDVAAATAFEDEEIEDYFDSMNDPGDGPSAQDFTAGSLEQDFGVPPFSVLNTTKAYWTERREQWKEMGLDNLRETPGREDAMVEGEGGVYTGDWGGGEDSGGVGGGMDGTGTSVFDPVLAELLYRWFAPSEGTVLDPFAGGPARAVVSAVTGRAYHGIDLNEAQVQHNRESWDGVADSDIDVDNAPQWAHGDSAEMGEHIEAQEWPDEYDFLFSCPPYHDLETYTDQDEDLSNMDYPEFLETYRTIIAQGVERLKEDRFAAFVVSEVRDDEGFYRGFVSDTVQAFEDAGMHLYNDAVLVNTPGTLPVRVRNYFERGRKLGRMHQNVLVFFKGDPDPSNIREQVGQVSVPSVVMGDGDSEDDSAETGAWAVEQDPEAQATEDNGAE